MGWRRHIRFLSVRGACVGLGLCAAAIAGAAGIIIGAVTGRAAYGALILCLVLLAASVLAGCVWIVLPYYRSERTIRAFLEEYPTSGAPGDEVPISTGTERLLEQARAVMNPSQLFKLNKRQAQYLALQNQINPHFLYNTLESIRSEALIAQLDSVADMTEALASFFRYTISKVENLVSVEEELQNCQTYFRIQSYRFGERLKLSIEYDPEDREEIFRCRLPKLTMQPILENSIIHGTELKIGTSQLTIHLERTQRRLLIRVSDNGIGMDAETLARVNGRLGRGGLSAVGNEREQRGGVALVNVDDRIRLLFGSEYGLHVFSIQGSGTDVEITLPAITSDREIPNQEALS